MSSDTNSTYPYQNPALSIDKRVSDLLSRMTTEEKVNQLRSQLLRQLNHPGRDYTVGNFRSPAHFAFTGETRPTAGECAKLNNDAQRQSIEASRWGIPAMIHDEGLHTAQWGDTTVFPQAIGLAASWNSDLMHKVATAIGAELSVVGVRQVLSPVVNIARDPRWGRAQESYGECPYLSSVFGAAYVKAVQKQGVACTPKHYIANYGDGGHDSWAVELSERALRETYLPPFEACVKEAGALSLMASYNSLNGTPCHCHKWLLTDVARDEWGFDGFVVSDYSAVSGVWKPHRVAETMQDAVQLCLESGMEIEFPNGGNLLLDMVNSGKLSMEVLDRAVSRLLKVKFMLGIFEEPYAEPDKADAVVRKPEHIQLSLDAALESMTLLKNDNKTLPLSDNFKRIGVFGPAANRMCLGDYTGPMGGWHGTGVTCLEGLLKTAPDGVEIAVPKDGETLENVAQSCDVNIYFATILESEGLDRCRIELPPDDFDENANKIQFDVNVIVDVLKSTEPLGGQETDILNLVKAGKPVIVVLLAGSPVIMSNWVDKVPAILQAWYPGELGGLAVAQTLFGLNNPAGRLPMTYPRHTGQVPIYYDFKPAYRWIHYSDNDGYPLYPFGHGLSYTEFEYSDLTVENNPAKMPDGKVSLSFDVKNIGDRAGDEVAQLYLRDIVSSIVTPLKRLRCFKRISLQPGETKRVTFELGYDDFALWNIEMKRVVEPGEFRIMIGSSSDDIRLFCVLNVE